MFGRKKSQLLYVEACQNVLFAPMGTFFQSAPSARKILRCTFSIWWCQSDPLSVFNATAEARLDYMPRKTLQQASVCSNRDNRGNLSQILLTLPSMCFARK